MKKAYLVLLILLTMAALLTACAPGEPQINAAPKNLRFLLTEPKAGTSVKDMDVSMTGQKAGTDYTLDWTVEYDALHSKPMQEEDVFFATYQYSVTIHYEMDEGDTPENTTVELVNAGQGNSQETTADGTHWTTTIDFSTAEYSASMYIATSNPAAGVPAKELGAYVTLETQELECTWQWAAINQKGAEKAVKADEALPEDAAAYTIYVSFLLPEGHTSESIQICVDPDADIGQICTDAKGNTVVPISYEKLLETSETVISIGEAGKGMTAAELAETVRVKVNGEEKEVYDFFVGHGGVNFLEETAVLTPGTYVGRVNFEGLEDWGWTMSPAAMGLEISDGYTPKYLVHYAALNFGLWVTFTVKDDNAVVITMDLPKPGDTTGDILKTAGVTIGGEAREVYDVFWMHDMDNWLSEGEQIQPGTYMGRINFEGSRDWGEYTDVDVLDLSMSDGYTATEMEHYAMLNYGVWFTFRVEDAPAATPVPTVTPIQENLPEEHQIHDFALTEAKNPTCTEDGYSLYTCQCGETYLETFPALGHSYLWIEDPLNWGQGTPTVGTHHWACARCGAVGESEAHALQEIETGHSQCAKCGAEFWSATN